MQAKASLIRLSLRVARRGSDITCINWCHLGYADGDMHRLSRIQPMTSSNSENLRIALPFLDTCS